jgi:hypothetical protein
MEQEVHNFGRFYATFNKMPYSGDREELKESLVSQYSGGRTESLRELTRREYDNMCCSLEQRYGGREALLAARRRYRSRALKLMQKSGIDTSDWTRINAFCKDARICGKEFARLDGEELEALSVKLRAIIRKGGLKQREEKQHSGSVVVVMENDRDCELN